MQSQLTSVEDFLISELKCPVCMEYMRPPIMLCENGHSICNICRPKVPHCPNCGHQFLNTRNVALEKLATEAKYPCVYRKYGCRKIYSFYGIFKHQEKCKYISKPCPINELNIGHCIWTGIKSSMRSHLKGAHPNMCMEYYGLGQASFTIRGVTPNTKNYKFILAHNDVFCICSEIKNGLLYSVLQYFGPAEKAANHRYKVEFFNKERTEIISVTRLARSWGEDLSEVYNSGNCVKLYPEQYNLFANEGSEMALSMEILTVKHNKTHGYL